MNRYKIHEKLRRKIPHLFEVGDRVKADMESDVRTMESRAELRGYVKSTYSKNGEMWAMVVWEKGCGSLNNSNPADWRYKWLAHE